MLTVPTYGIIVEHGESALVTAAEQISTFFVKYLGNILNRGLSGVR